MANALKVKHFLDSRQAKDPKFLIPFFGRITGMKEAIRMRRNTKHHERFLVASEFFEASTRTRFSFESAAKRLGARVIATENAKEFSSGYKGESLKHSILAIQDGFDAFIIRHHESGSLARIVLDPNPPFIVKTIINAGDGTNQHPTQSLLDAFTIWERFGRLEGLKIAFIGDILQGRTNKSLAFMLAHFPDNEFFFVAPSKPIDLNLPAGMAAYLDERGVKFHKTDDIDSVLPQVNIVYDTRLQWERIKDEDKQREQELRKAMMLEAIKFQITRGRVNMMKQDAILMHPLPINTTRSEGYPEITTEVDADPRAHYFVQSNNGLPTRMALLDILFRGEADELYNLIGDVPEPLSIS
jgi:aspartate carbamoyltransferase catalytic subunit